MAIASSMFFMPIASSARPGMGKVRVTAPAVTTSTSYSRSYARPSLAMTATLRSAWSMDVAVPATTLVRRR